MNGYFLLDIRKTYNDDGNEERRGPEGLHRKGQRFIDLTFTFP